MARGLVGFYVLNKAGLVEDLADSNHGRYVSGGDYQVVPSDNGMSTRFGNTDSKIHLGNAGRVGLNGASAFTVAGIARIDSGSLHSSFMRLVDKSTAGGTANGWAVFHSNSAGLMTMQVRNNTSVVQINEPTRDEWFTYIASSELMGTTANNIVSLDGVPQSFVKNTLNETAFPTATADIYIGGLGAVSQGWDGDIELIAIWDRGFTEAEHASFADDPYQFVEVASQNLSPLGKAAAASVDVSGTDISTTPAVDAGTIVQTHLVNGTDISATPTVGSGTITQTHLVSGSDISATPSLDAGSITQTHVVSGTDISATPEIDAGSITQTHLISGTDMSATPTVGVGTAIEVGQARAAAMRLGSTEATFAGGASSAAIGGIATSATIGNDGKTGA